MAVNDAAWERIKANPAAPRASFLSMLDWKEKWIDGNVFPFTPSVVDMHGIQACCDQLLEGGARELDCATRPCGARRARASRRWGSSSGRAARRSPQRA